MITPGLELLQLLSVRIERLSADSRWSHRASGLRGNILKLLAESESQFVSSERVDLLLDHGFRILTAAAKEIPDLDEIIRQYHSEITSPPN